MSAPSLPRIGLFVGEWGSQNMVDLLARSCSLFNSLQSIQDSIRSSGNKDSLNLGPSTQQIAYYSRFTSLYRKALLNFINNSADVSSKLRFQLQLLTSFLNLPVFSPSLSLAQPTLSPSSSASNDLPPKIQAQELHTILHLAHALFIPADGRGLGVVGEELLDWWNVADCGPTTEKGLAIASLKVPYEDPEFSNYNLSCVLRGFHPAAASMLRTLSSSPYPTLTKVGNKISSLLLSFPRSTSFSLESDFLSSHRKWLGQLRPVLSGLEAEMDQLELEMKEIGGLQEDEAEEERWTWEAEFTILLRIMAGSKDQILECSGSWKEALGAWGILVSPSLKRDDVPAVTELILQSMSEKFGSDASKAEQMMRELASGRPNEAIQLSKEVDPWLSCHMTDLFSRIGVLDDEVADQNVMTGIEEDEESSFSPLNSSQRFESLHKYASYLLEDQGLWRIALDYLAQSQPSRNGMIAQAEQARRAMRGVIMKVPVLGATKGKGRKLDEPIKEKDGDESRTIGKQEEEQDEFETADDLMEACEMFGMEKERRLICKKLARELSSQSRFSSSLIFAILASDLSAIQRISDFIIDTYIERGSKAFIALVDSLPQGLLSPFQSVDDEEFSEDELEMQEEDALDQDFERKPERSKLVETKSQRREKIAIKLANQRGLNTGLLFLGYYRDFLRNYQEGHLRNSARLIIELLQSEVAPQRFWAVLLIDSVPLLRSLDPPYFTSSETFELMRCVETVTSASRVHPKEASYWLSSLEKILTRISNPTSEEEREREKNGDEDVFMEVEIDLGGSRGEILSSSSVLGRLDVVRLAASRHLAKESAGKPGYH